MRGARLVGLFLLLLIPAPAGAQYGGGEGHHGRGPAAADSAHVRSITWQGWGHFGAGWLGAPEEIRTRYGAGLDVGLSGDRRLEQRWALRARLDLHDLPSSQPTYIVDAAGNAYSTDIGHAWLASGLAGAAVRAWGNLWLEGGAGGGYFQSGFSDEVATVDSTGEVHRPEGTTGWGKVWSLGTRYEFHPTRRDRMLAEFQFYSLDREGTRLKFFAVRIGYRLL